MCILQQISDLKQCGNECNKLKSKLNENKIKIPLVIVVETYFTIRIETAKEKRPGAREGMKHLRQPRHARHRDGILEQVNLKMEVRFSIMSMDLMCSRLSRMSISPNFIS